MEPNPAFGRYRPDVDGLRGVAVLSVVIFHLFPSLLPGGFAGVDVFFVISGFLISRILAEDLARPGSALFGVLGRFYARRIRRLFPALAAVLVATLVMGWVAMLPDEYKKLGRQAAAGIGFYINILQSRESGYFNGGAAARPLLHLWSLGIEEQFYLLWPLILWIIFRFRSALVPTTVFLLVFSFGWNAHKTTGTAAAAFFLPQNRMWELLIGALATWWYRRDDSSGGQAGAVARAVAALVGLGCVVYGVATAHAEATVPNGWTLLPTVGAAFVLWAGPGSRVSGWVLDSRPLVGLGLVSYPLYLWHWPLLVFSRELLDHPSSAWVRSGVLGLALLLAILTYRWIERPVRNGKPSLAKVASLLAVMAAILGFALLIVSYSGFPGRYPPLIQKLTDFHYDNSGAERPGYFIGNDDDETAFRYPPDFGVGGKPVAYLWGDSHAAALYPGLEASFGRQYCIVQRTAANTPPSVPPAGITLSTRDRINRFIVESIRKDRPDLVILDGNWVGFGWGQMESTIAALRRLGVDHIVVFGPVPEWNISLPQQLFNYVRRHPRAPLPWRISSGSLPESRLVDEQMAAACKRLGVDYVSPVTIFGGLDGYLIRFGDRPEDLASFDYGHLTKAGSLYLAAHVPSL
jgi:peptidoglycan/LPS O-acetylase OafA/YrhL